MNQKHLATVPAMGISFLDGAKRFIKTYWESEPRQLDRMFMDEDRTFFTVVNGTRTYEIKLEGSFYKIYTEVSDD